MRKKAVLFAAASLSLLPEASFAQQRSTWTNQTGNGLWADAGNWNNGLPSATTWVAFGTSGSIDLGGQTRTVDVMTGSNVSQRFFNGTLRASTFSKPFMGTIFDCNLQPGATFVDLTWNGEVNGAVQNGTSPAAVRMGGVLSGENTYTGRTYVQSISTIRGANGSIRNSQSIQIDQPIPTQIASPTFTLDNSLATNADRLSNSASIQLRGTLVLTSGAGVSEQIGTLSLFASAGEVQLKQDVVGAQNELSMLALHRPDGESATILFPDDSGAARLRFANNPGALGGGADVTQRAVIPYLFADVGSIRPMAYIPGTGSVGSARPMRLNEFVDLTSAEAQSNVRLTGSATAPNSRTINSLFLDAGPTLTISPPGILDVDSGVVLMDGARVDGVGILRSPGEMVVYATAPAAISQGAGFSQIDVPVSAATLTKLGPGTLRLSRSSTYSRLIVGGGVFEAGEDGALGSGTITFHGGAVKMDYGSTNLLRPLEFKSFTVPGMSSDAFRTSGEINIPAGTEINHVASINGTGILDITGGGRFRLAGDRTLSDFRFRTSGDVAFELAGLTSVTPTGAEISLNGRIEGSGTFDGILAGVISPGAPAQEIGTLFARSLRLSTRFPNKHIFDIDGLVAGTGYDQLIARDLVALTATFIAELELRPSIEPPVGSTFTLIDNRATGFSSAVAGTYLGLPESSVFESGGVLWRISYVGGTGNDVVLTVVPEPSSGAAILLLLRRRRRTSAVARAEPVAAAQ